MVKVTIADEQSLTREGISNILNNNKDFTITIKAENGNELINRINNDGIPDIAIINVNLPIMDGYTTVTALSASFPQIKIIGLTLNDDETSIQRMYNAGASAFINKNMKPSQILHIVQGVAYNTFNKTNLSAAQLFKLVKNKQKQFSLSHKEKEMLEYCATDMTYKEIAKSMNLSPKTIENYRESLFIKIQVKSRVSLVVKAIKNGLIHIK